MQCSTQMHGLIHYATTMLLNTVIYPNMNILLTFPELAIFRSFPRQMSNWLFQL